MRKIVSGGQTGADRAALAWALENNFSHGGWCPRGRLAEDGRIEERFYLEETPNEKSGQRTDWNTRDSDGTVIFSVEEGFTGGTQFTADCAKKNGKPFLIVLGENPQGGSELREFCARWNIETLNVAGNRASKWLGIEKYVKKVLTEAFIKS